MKLFTDRDYVIQEMPKEVSDLSFIRKGIEKVAVECTHPGTLYALTPTVRPKAASQEAELQKVGFSKVDAPETQLFPGEINRVGLWRKEVKAGERFAFKKLVLFIYGKDTQVKSITP